MAGLKCYYNSDVEFTLDTGAGWFTLLLLKAPANHPLIIDNWGVQPRGVNNADKPLRTRLVRVTTDGAGSTDKSTDIGVRNGRSETPQATILDGGATSPHFSTEPTLDSRHTVRGMTTHPQAGQDLPSIDRGDLMVPGGGRVALQVNNEGGGSISCESELSWEE